MKPRVTHIRHFEEPMEIESIGFGASTYFQTKADYLACEILGLAELRISARQFPSHIGYFLALRVLNNARSHLRNQAPLQPNSVHELLAELGE